MSTTLTDPRTEQVQCNVDNCTDHTDCPMCEVEWDRHQRVHRPWWRRWLP